MPNATQRYLLAQRLPGPSPILAFRASHPAGKGQFRIDVLAGLEAPAQQAYLRDQEAVAGLRHPHILPLVETTALPDGTAVCVTRWPAGSTLQARLDAGTLAPEAALGLITAVSDALAAAHARGITHGRLRADQILLPLDDGPAGGPWLFGFGARHLAGVARVTEDDCARDLADLADVAGLLHRPDAAPAVESPPPVPPEPAREGAIPPAVGQGRYRRHWVGMVAGAAVGAALTALLLLPVPPPLASWRAGLALSQAVPVKAVEPPPVDVARVNPANPTPPPAEPTPPPAEPTPPAAELAPPPAELAPPPAEPAPPPAAPSPPTPALVQRIPPPTVSRRVRSARRPVAPPPIRRGLVWSARTQRLVQVDEQGLPLESPPPPPPPASTATPATPAPVPTPVDPPAAGSAP